MPALQSEAMRYIKYEDMADIYNVFWFIDKPEYLCADVDSHINKMYSAFHNLKDFLYDTSTEWRDGKKLF